MEKEQKKEVLLSVLLVIMISIFIIVTFLYIEHQNSVNPNTIKVAPLINRSEQQILKESVLIDVNTTHIYCDEEISLKSTVWEMLTSFVDNKQIDLMIDMFVLLKDIDSQLQLVKETNEQDIVVPQGANGISIKKTEYGIDTTWFMDLLGDEMGELKRLLSHFPDELSIYMWKEEYDLYSGVSFRDTKFVYIYNEYYIYGEIMSCKDKEKGNIKMLFGTHS